MLGYHWCNVCWVILRLKKLQMAFYHLEGMTARTGRRITKATNNSVVKETCIAITNTCQNDLSYLLSHLWVVGLNLWPQPLMTLTSFIGLTDSSSNTSRCSQIPSTSSCSKAWQLTAGVSWLTWTFWSIPDWIITSLNDLSLYVGPVRLCIGWIKVELCQNNYKGYEDQCRLCGSHIM